MSSMGQSYKCPNCKKLARELAAVRAENAALRQENAEIKRRLAALEDEIRRCKRQAAPFSRDRTKAERKKPGRRKGQGTFDHRRPPHEGVTETVTVPLDRCPVCGGPLSDKRTHEHIQTDLPRPEPTHTRFVNESGYCAHCRRRFRSRHPQQGSTASGAAGVSVGPNARATAADLHHRLGVPYAKIADHFKTAAGLDVTPSALCQSNERLAAKLNSVYKELVAALRRACAVHADETGWRIGTLSAWLWVFTSRHVTVYVIDESRGHEVVVEILGREFKGTLVGDCFLAYDHKDFADWIKQKCLAHLLKDLRKIEAEKTRGAVCFPRAVTQVLHDALALRDEKPTLTPHRFARRLGRIERRLDALIDESRIFSDPDNARFAKRLRKQRPHLFTFLTLDGVDATNNAAERQLRPAVIVRKTGGCNKTAAGALTHAVNASVLQTARQNGINPVAYVTHVLASPVQPRPPLPVFARASP